MFDQVRTMTCCRNQHIVGSLMWPSTMTEVLVYVTINTGYKHTVSKGSLWGAVTSPKLGPAHGSGRGHTLEQSHLHNTTNNNQLKMGKRLECKIWNHRTPRNKYREWAPWHWLWWFFRLDTKSKDNKSKNKQVGLHQTRKLLYSKGTHQQMEKQPMEWEKIFVNHIHDKGLISNIRREPIQLNSKKTPIWFKNGQRNSITFE